VGTKSGVHRFGPGWKSQGRIALEPVAFAGPGGKDRDRVYAVDRRSAVHVLVLQ